MLGRALLLAFMVLAVTAVTAKQDEVSSAAQAEGSCALFILWTGGEIMFRCETCPAEVTGVETGLKRSCLGCQVGVSQSGLT